jgi:triacylglycerol lipase
MPLEPREPPLETIQGLHPPLAGFPYCAHADRFPFEPEAAGESAVNAWWLADLSFLVYGSADFVEDALARSPLPAQGYRLSWLGTPEINRGMVLGSHAALIVIFRGTRLHVRSLMDLAELVVINQSDLWTDSQFFPAVCQAGGRVHAGFLRAFAEICAELDALVQAKPAGQKLWLAGHSLGGALATLAAAHIGREAVQGLYTYGCPRVGDSKFASVLPESGHFRFVHRDDWVVEQPPALLGYVHGGTLKQVVGSPRRNLWRELRDKTEVLTVALRAMAQEMRLNVGELPFTVAGLADHMPIYYATYLWNALASNEPERSLG